MKNTKLVFISLFILAFSLLSCQKEPTAQFIASKLVALPNESIVFTNSSTDANNYEWNFGDGSTGSENNPSHVFLSPGDYIVTLTAFSKNGKKSNSLTQNISVGLSPVCAFGFLPRYPKPDEYVNFTDNSSNSPSAWYWDFNDGTTSTEKNPVHNFTAEKTYNVTLTVSNIFGSATQTSSIIVTNNTPVAPVAQFTYSFQSNYNVAFQDQSTGVPTTWLWTFGDGSTSTLQNPTHQYAQIGTYPVTLKVGNLMGYNQISQNIEVTNNTYAFLVGSYAVVDVANGSTTNYTDNITASPTNLNKFFCNKFANYSNGLVYFLVNGTNLSIPSQVVHCGIPPYDVDHTFSGSGSYSLNGSNVNIYTTYTDASSFGIYTGCTGSYTRLKGKFKIDNTTDKTWYLLQQLKK